MAAAHELLEHRSKLAEVAVVVVVIVIVLKGATGSILATDPTARESHPWSIDGPIDGPVSRIIRRPVHGIRPGVGAVGGLVGLLGLVGLVGLVTVVGSLGHGVLLRRPEGSSCWEDGPLDNHEEHPLSSPAPEHPGGADSDPVRAGVVVAVAGPGAAPGVPALRIARLLAGERHRPSGAARTPVAEVRVLAGGRGQLDGAQWHVTDTAKAGVLDELAGVDVLVWVAVATDLAATLVLRPADRRAALLHTARALLVSAVAAGVRHVVVVSSAEVYGARADNPVPLPDDAPLEAVRDAALVSDLLAVEDVVAQSRANHPGVHFTVVRPAVLVGAGIDTTLTRYFEAPRLLAVKGTTPLWQFCHVDDLASAVLELVAPRGGGGCDPLDVVTVGCDDALSLREVERLAGMRRIEVGETTATATATQLHRVGVLPSPASDLAFVMHPWTVGSVTLRARGWHPAYDNGTCLGVLLEAIGGRHAVAGRRIERRDAALGAASAAVALAATAAVLRRARRH